MSTLQRFIAAAIPRNLRQKRLWYIPLSDVIGTKTTTSSYDDMSIFDIILFTPEQYERARMYLGYQQPASPSMQQSQETFAFIPQFVEHFETTEQGLLAREFAKTYFIKVFKL